MGARVCVLCVSAFACVCCELSTRAMVAARDGLAVCNGNGMPLATAVSVMAIPYGGP